VPLTLWKSTDYFEKTPHHKFVKLLGRKKWDSSVKYHPVSSNQGNNELVFTMPSFARHGRWGNIVFQYIFMRIIALNNNATIELNKGKSKGSLETRMNFYKDMLDVKTVSSAADTMILDSYHIFPPTLTYVPMYFWRAMYASEVRQKTCFLVKDVEGIISKPLPGSLKGPVEIEGLFMVNPQLYKDYRDHIVNNLFNTTDDFRALVNECVENLGRDKTLIGIHIRRGDYVENPLGVFSQTPIHVRYINQWLISNVSALASPVIYICSDDADVHTEITVSGVEVFTTKQLLPSGIDDFKYEQLDWEILRRCDVLLTSNSSFSFTSALLSLKTPRCYNFSFTNSEFSLFDPWNAEPLQTYPLSDNFFGYLSSRFKLVSQMVGRWSALGRLRKDVFNWLLWKFTKVIFLRYKYGISWRVVYKMLNLFELFRLPLRKINYRDNNSLSDI
jgi:hypothetical protein